MTPAKDILIVDDEVGIRELLSEILQDEGYRVSLAENATAARAYRAREQPALVLLDIWMPDTDGVTLLREWAASGQLTMPVVMMSGHGTIETAVEATKIGAFDFLEKPVGLQKLLGTVSRALKTASAREPRRVSLAALGTSAAVRDVERQLEQLLAARKPILILGEPGTGHDAAARALHAPDTPRVVAAERRAARGEPARACSRRRATACSIARRSANTRRPSSAGSRSCCPSSTRRTSRSSARAPSSLGNLAAEGKFDAALLAALSAGAVLLPPLRARREDIPALIDRFWAEVAAQERNAQQAAARVIATLQPAALTALTGAYWPGNLDHLQSVVANLALYRGLRRHHDRSRQAAPGRGGGGEPGRRARDHRALLRVAAARGARGVRADLFRAAARARAEQHEPRRRARRARAHAPLSEAEAALHPLCPARRRRQRRQRRRLTRARVSRTPPPGPPLSALRRARRSACRRS